MPKRRKVIVGPSRLDRARARSGLGSLAFLQVTPGAARRYSKAVRRFLQWVMLLFGSYPNNWDELDVALGDYIQACWLEGDSRATVADAICGLQHYLRKRRVLSFSWKLLNIWEKYEVPNRIPPLSSDMLFALCGIFVSQGDFEMSVVLILAFDCLLRTGEVLDLQCCHVAWTDCKFSLAIFGKSGARYGVHEEVVSTDEFCFALLRKLLTQKSPMERVYGGTVKSFRQKFSHAIEMLGLNSSEWKPYGLRRGGATYSWIQSRNAADLCMRGRWSSLKTARLYAVEGHELLRASRLSEQQRLAISSWGAYFKACVPRLL